MAIPDLTLSIVYLKRSRGPVDPIVGWRIFRFPHGWQSVFIRLLAVPSHNEQVTRSQVQFHVGCAFCLGFQDESTSTTPTQAENGSLTDRAHRRHGDQCCGLVRTNSARQHCTAMWVIAVAPWHSPYPATGEPLLHLARWDVPCSSFHYNYRTIPTSVTIDSHAQPCQTDGAHVVAMDVLSIRGQRLMMMQHPCRRYRVEEATISPHARSKTFDLE